MSSGLAGELLKIAAIQINLEQPFTWSSGLKSPIYCDNRQTLAYPVIRYQIKQAFINLIKTNFPDSAVVAGVATGGIPYAALIADSLHKPLVYVRPKAKNHGLKRQVEGKLEAGQKVVVIEDLISTGQSSLQAIRSLQAEDAEVLGLCAIVNYSFEQTHLRFQRANIPTYSLTEGNTIFKSALEMGRITQVEYDKLLTWHSKLAF